VIKYSAHKLPSGMAEMVPKAGRELDALVAERLGDCLATLPLTHLLSEQDLVRMLTITWVTKGRP